MGWCSRRPPGGRWASLRSPTGPSRSGRSDFAGRELLPGTGSRPLLGVEPHVEDLGLRRIYLGRHVEGIESFAQDGQHCAWYRDASHAAELVRQYLSRPAERDRIARAGRAHALASHTYAHRLQLLLAGEDYPLPTIL